MKVTRGQRASVAFAALVGFGISLPLILVAAFGWVAVWALATLGSVNAPTRVSAAEWAWARTQSGGIVSGLCTAMAVPITYGVVRFEMRWERIPEVISSTWVTYSTVGSGYAGLLFVALVGAYLPSWTDLAIALAIVATATGAYAGTNAEHAEAQFGAWWALFIGSVALSAVAGGLAVFFMFR